MLHLALGKLHCQILFHHDNAPVHTAKTVKTILQEFHWEILSHPPYSSRFPSETLVKLSLQFWLCVLEQCHRLVKPIIDSWNHSETKLTFSQHINVTITKAKLTLYILKALTSTKQGKQKELIVFTFKLSLTPF